MDVSAHGLTFQTFEGAGRVRNTRSSFGCAFSIVQFHDGTILVGCTTPLPLAIFSYAVESMSGRLIDGREVLISLYGYTRDSLGHPALEGHDAVLVARHVYVGDPLGSGEWVYWLANLVGEHERLTVSLGSALAEVAPTPDRAEVEPYLRSAFGVAVTSTLRFPAPDRDAADQIAEDICNLLSIGTGNRVQWVTRARFVEGLEVGRDLVAAVTKRFTHPLGVVPQDLQHFLDCCWAHIDEARARWKLRHLVGLQSDSRSHVDFLELRCVKTVVAMEAVKAIFLEAASKPSGKSRRPAFADVVKQLLATVGSTLDHDDVAWFVQCRNSAVHTGLPWSRSNKVPANAPFQEHITEFFWLQKFLARVLLCVAGYHGPCIDASTALKRTTYSSP